MKIEPTPSTAATRRRRGFTAMLTALVVGVALGTAPAIASAGVADSAVAHWSGYQGYSQIRTSTGSAGALTQVGPVNFVAPAGWVGSQGRLLRSNGFIQCEGSFQYNAGALSAGGWNGGASCSVGGSGAWYSRGEAVGWTGSSYSSNGMPASPNQNS